MYQQSNVFLILSFLQAIELASEVLANVKFIQEKKLIGEQFCYICNLFLHSIASLHMPHGTVSLWQISMIIWFNSFYTGRYFDEISQDTGKYCFGVDDTLKVCYKSLSLMYSFSL